MVSSSTIKRSSLVLALSCSTIVLQAQTVFFSWVNKLGSQGYDYATSVVTDALGNVYTTGEFRGSADFDPGAGTTTLTSAGADDIFVTKLDANGSLVWAVRMGGTGADIGNDISVDAYGNVYVAGTFESTADFDPGNGTANLTSTMSTSSFAVKLSPGGGYSWAKMVGSNLGTVTNSVEVNAGGTVHLVGDFSGTADLNPDAGTATAITTGQTDIYIVELDSAGAYQWSKSFGGNSYDHCAAIAADASGNLFLTGYFTATCDFEPGAGSTTLTAASTDIFVASYDPAGTLAWAKQMGGSGSDGGTAIIVDNNGDVLTTGYFDGNADFDPGAGTHILSAATGISDAFVSKLNSAGAYSWSAQFGGTSVDAGQSITIDVAGNIYTTGRYSGTADFDPSANTANLVSSGTYDVYVSKLSASGSYVWAHQMGGASNDVGNCVAVDASNNVVTVGYFAGSCDFDPQGTTASLSTAGLDDIFITKWSQSAVGVEEFPTNEYAVFPNPSNGMLTINATSDMQTANMNIYSSLGSLVQTQQANGQQIVIDLSELVQGFYILEIDNGNSKSRINVMKQ